MTERDIEYSAEGLTMRGRLFAQDAPGKRPGVLVFPEVFGLNAHALERAKRLAALGYVVMACDLHGGGRELEPQAAMEIGRALRADPLRIRARTEPALAALVARADVDRARCAAIGFCFGGTMALELARGGADLRAVVGFHSGLATTRPQDAKNIKARVLVCIGADDPGIPAPQRAAFETEMRDGGVAWEMHLYGGVVHSFTNPDASKMNQPALARYDARADRVSWTAMREVFSEMFAVGGMAA
jgi:dienelactone hydrolase